MITKIKNGVLTLIPSSLREQRELEELAKHPIEVQETSEGRIQIIAKRPDGRVQIIEMKK